jgi:tetratricopeptide (TPR) repeat protein
VGEIMPEFSLADANGIPFVYKHGQARVLGILILQAGQGNTERIMADVKALGRELRLEDPAFDCVGVISGPGAREFIQTRDSGSAAPFPLMADPNFAFWGRLGVIAAPTAVVVGSDGKIQWARAGYGYDFISGFHAQLRQALGLSGGRDASAQVEVLENASVRARRERHIQLARTLARKGRIGPAVDDLQKVYDLDPNVLEIALELAEMLCRAGKNDAALRIATTAKVRTGQDKARSLLICGWARRQMKQLDMAESLLKSALELTPRSARVLYELGRVYESAGNAEQALACYRRGLAEVFEEAGVVEVSHE